MDYVVVATSAKEVAASTEPAYMSSDRRIKVTHRVEFAVCTGGVPEIS